MTEPTSEATPRVASATARPKGILPANLKNWFLIGGGVLVVLFVLFNSGGSSAKDKKAMAAEAAKPVVLDPSQARIQEYRKKIDIEARKLETEQERLKQVQDSLGVPANARPSGALQSMYPPGVPPGMSSGMAPGMGTNQTGAAQTPPIDPIKADREKREYASLFASSVALSYRPGLAAGGAKNEKTESSETPTAPTPELPLPAGSPFSAAREHLTPGTPTNATASAAKPADTSEAGVAEQDEETASGRDTSGERNRGRKRPNHPAEIRQSDGASHRLFEGTVLETVLTNRIAGDFSGPVNCLVSTNVYSHNRQHLLIPQGSRVLGEVKRVTNFGQQRVAVFFHRLVMPDGYSVDLDQFQGLNQIGETGLKDQVNHHYAAIFGSSLALGAIAGFSEAGTAGGFVTSGIDSYRQGFSNSLAQSSQRILDKFLNQLPTITIREGYRVKVYLAGDLLLPDFNRHRIPDDL